MICPIQPSSFSHHLELMVAHLDWLSLSLLNTKEYTPVALGVVTVIVGRGKRPRADDMTGRPYWNELAL